jgi:hypothetical protein
VNGYTADFLGGANLIPAGEGTFRVVRREDIQIGSRAAAGSTGTRDDTPGVIEHVEFRGALTGYRVRTGEAIVHVDAPGPPKHARGEEVMLRYPADSRIVEGG